MYLDALLPPGNVGAVLAALKRELFRQDGLVSSRSLPPLIPLGWYRELPVITEEERAGRSRDYPPTPGWGAFRLEPRFREYRENFYLPVEISLTEEGLLLPVSAESPEGTPFFPFPGIHMGSLEEAGTLPPCPEVPREALGWRRCSRVLFRVRWAQDVPWWNFLELEEVI